MASVRPLKRLCARWALHHGVPLAARDIPADVAEYAADLRCKACGAGDRTPATCTACAAAVCSRCAVGPDNNLCTRCALECGACAAWIAAEEAFCCDACYQVFCALACMPYGPATIRCRVCRNRYCRACLGDAFQTCTDCSSVPWVLDSFDSD